MEQADQFLKTFAAEANPVFIHIRKSHKKIKTDATRIKHVNKLIESLNKLTRGLRTLINKLSPKDKEHINKLWTDISANIKIALDRVKYTIGVHNDVFKQKNINLIQPPQAPKDNTDTGEDDVEEEDNLGDQDTINISVIMPFDVKGALSILSPCDGSPDQVSQLLDSLEVLEQITSAENMPLLYKVVKTKLTGKARTVSAGATDITTLREQLKKHCSPTETSQAILMRLKAVKQTSDAATYASKVEEITEKLAAQYMREGIPAANAQQLADSTGIDALVQGARNPQTRFILRSGEFDSLSKAVTKLLKEDAAPSEVAQILALHGYRGGQRGGGRGAQRGGRFNNRNGGRFNGGGRNGQYRQQNGGQQSGGQQNGGQGGWRGRQRRSDVRVTSASQENEQGPLMELGAHQQQQQRQQ